MSEMPWSKFFWSDWDSDEALQQCSLAAQGLWMRMLCICAKGDPIGFLAIAGNPLDVRGVAKSAGIELTEAETLMDELAKWGVFSRDRNGRIYSRRMVREAKRSAEGRKHIRKRWSQDTEKTGEIPSPTSPPSRSPTTQKLEARDQKEREEDSLDLPFETEPIAEPVALKEKGGTGRAPPAEPSEFDVWYQAYPRHVGRGQAEKAYAAARRKVPAETLLAAVTRAAGDLRSRDPKFIPHPATWLNGERWLDGQAAPASAVPSIVTEARAYGWPVEREGKYWRVAGALYDEGGEQIGN